MTYGSDLTAADRAREYDVWDSNGAPMPATRRLPTPVAPHLLQLAGAAARRPATSSSPAARLDRHEDDQQPEQQQQPVRQREHVADPGPTCWRSRWYSSSITLINGGPTSRAAPAAADRPDPCTTARFPPDTRSTRAGSHSYPRNFVAPDGACSATTRATARCTGSTPPDRIDHAGGLQVQHAYSGGWFSSTAM